MLGRLRAPLASNAVAALLACGIWPAWVAEARAQPADHLWGEIALPGGAAAARTVAGVGNFDARLDAGFLLDLTRKFDGVTKNPSVKLLEDYLAGVDDIQTGLGSWPDGLTLPTTATSAGDRDRSERALATLGLGMRRRDNQYEAYARDDDQDRERLGWLKALGVQSDRVLADLNAGLAVKIPIGTSSLPLPLPDFWRENVFARDRMPLWSIVNDRSAALLYHGLMGLDDETLTFLSTRPNLVRELQSNNASFFAAFGRSIRVRDGRILVPGGAEAEAVWEDLVGRTVTDPERFIRSLLARDEGRFAYFYDVVAHLGPTQQRAALALDLPEKTRGKAAEHIVERFEASSADWPIDLQPFGHPAFGAGQVLAITVVRPDGTVGPLWWPSLFERITNVGDWPATPAVTLHDLKDRPADFGWLLDWLFAQPNRARDRFAMFRLAQRLFADTPRTDAPAVELSLRAMKDMPALAWSLERMGVRDPALFAAVGERAHTLTYAGGADAVLPSLARWQSALGLLEQIQRRAHLSDASLRPLLTTLLDATPARLDRPSGSIAAWVVDQLLPAFLRPGDETGDIEERALQRFTATRTDDKPFTWEGLPYVVDVGMPTFKNALAVRVGRHGPRLQDLVALLLLRRALEAGPKTLDEVRSIEARFAAVESGVSSLQPIGGRPPAIVRAFHDAAVSIQQIKKPGDVNKVVRQLPVVIDTLDAITDAVLQPMLYALAVAPTPTPVSYAATWTAHSLRQPTTTSDAVTIPWRTVAWQLPVFSSGDGRGGHLNGALLGVDVALATSQLVRVPSADVPGPQILKDEDYLAAAQVLVAPDSDFREDAAQVVRAISSGRSMVTRWRSNTPDRRDLAAALRAAAIDEWRVNLINWTTHSGGGEDPFQALSPVELYRLGSNIEPGAAWSGASEGLDGCYCRLSAERHSARDIPGIWTGVVGLGPQDLPLRLGDILGSMHLTPALVPALLPMAMQDWLDHVQPAWADDWEAVVAWPGTLTQTRVEEYLLALVSEGVLAAPATAPTEAVQWQ